MTDYGKYLETYTLEELFELNDLTEEDILKFLVEAEFLVLPTPKPVDLNV